MSLTWVGLIQHNYKLYSRHWLSVLREHAQIKCANRMCYISPSKLVDNRDKIDKLWPINLVIQGLCLDSMLRIPEVQVQVRWHKWLDVNKNTKTWLILKFPHEMCCFSCGVIWLSIVEMSCFLNLLWQPQEPSWTENYAVKRAKMLWFIWTATAFDIQKLPRSQLVKKRKMKKGVGGS